MFPGCNVNWDATTMGCFPLPPSDYRALSPPRNRGWLQTEHSSPPLTIFCPTDTLNVANTRNVLYTKYVRVKVLVPKISLCLCVHEGYQ